eukprot:657303-Prorocentrum_minimum.AAC.3
MYMRLRGSASPETRAYARRSLCLCSLSSFEQDQKGQRVLGKVQADSVACTCTPGSGVRGPGYSGRAQTSNQSIAFFSLSAGTSTSSQAVWRVFQDRSLKLTR